MGVVKDIRASLLVSRGLPSMGCFLTRTPERSFTSSSWTAGSDSRPQSLSSQAPTRISKVLLSTVRSNKPAPVPTEDALGLAGMVTAAPSCPILRRGSKQPRSVTLRATGCDFAGESTTLEFAGCDFAGCDLAATSLASVLRAPQSVFSDYDPVATLRPWPHTTPLYFAQCLDDDSKGHLLE